MAVGYHHARGHLDDFAETATAAAARTVARDGCRTGGRSIDTYTTACRCR